MSTAHPTSPRVDCLAAVLGAALLAAACSTPPTASAVEDILVLRSLRVERSLPSVWCTAERAGFAPLKGPSLLEDRFSMHSVALTPASGRVADGRLAVVGELRTCLGFTADPRVTNFYAEGQLAGVRVVGSGECVAVQANYPEPGITPVRCHLRLRDLPAPYVGGLLTSNTVVSKAVLGLETDPPGYLQASIATVRLWRAR